MIVKKLGTFARVAREGGVSGISSLLQEKARHLTNEVRILDTAAACAWTAARHGRPNKLVCFRAGIGDDVLCTAPLHELRRRGYRGVWMMSRYRELYEHSTDVDLVVPWGLKHEQWIDRLNWSLLHPWYTSYIRGEDRDVSPDRHIITLMCRQVGIVGDITLRPYVTLTDAEREGGQRVRRQVTIQAGGLTAAFAMRTKQWIPERYQAVVDLLRDRYDIVQIGSPADPALEGVLDLRGKATLRESAAILSRSLAFIGTVGMPMHLARAVDCRSVIVYGGRERPWQTGYPCNENLTTELPCSPCWYLNTCVNKMACMRAITPEMVAAAVDRQVARFGEPLEVDTDVITVDEAEGVRTPDGRWLQEIADANQLRRMVELVPLAH